MPVNLSLNNSTTIEHQGSKYDSTGLTGGIRGGDGKSEGGVYFALVKTEGQKPMGESSCGGSYPAGTGEQREMVYRQSCYDLSLSGYLKDEQRSTPDSTYEEAVEGEVSGGDIMSCFTLFVLFALCVVVSCFPLGTQCISSSFTDVPEKSLLRT